MLSKFLIIALLVFAINASAQVPAGATKQDVIEKLGWPKSTSGSADREILNYADYSVLLVNGLVTKVEIKPKDSKKPGAYSPQTPKSIPGSTTQTRLPAPAVVPASSPNGVEISAPRPVVPVKPPVPTVVSRPPARPFAQPPAAPPDIFAPAKKLIFGIMLVFVALAAAKLWVRAYLKPNRKKFEDLFYSSNTPHVAPSLNIVRAVRTAEPDLVTADWSLELLKKIEWHRFEHLAAAYERELGNEAGLTDFGPDGGVDVKVFEKKSRAIKRVIQCKAFDNQKVGVDLVRAFYGAMALHKAPEGAFYTTSSYTDDALAIARENSNLVLIDGPTFLHRIKQLSPDAQLRLFDVATQGDYTTLTCANCGIKMVFRTPENGRSFWGCTNFPRGCKNKLYVTRIG
jgi:hypothetical protein